MLLSRRKLHPARTALLTVAGTIAFLGIWYLAAYAGFAPREFLPTPDEVLATLVHLIQTPFSGFTIQDHLLASLQRFAFGFGLAVLIGVPLGLMMGWFRLLDEVVSPVFNGLRFIPPIAWVPFAALWFGTGIGGPVLVIFTGAFPPCLINSYRGARYVETYLIEAARTLGLSNLRMISQVLFPAALPSIIAGLRISAGLAWMSLIGAELIVASSGIGYLLVKGQSALNASIVMAGMFSIGVVGILIDILIRLGGKRLLRQ